jgi:predicted 3-demethylubiquinone-9 3-methyltransferase (glyoxalase superfamily)
MVELLADRDREKAHRVANAMLQMKKIQVKELERAYEEVRMQ